MPKADTSVKWFRSSMQGLGSFGASAGTRLPTLKQMLRDGFNSLQLTSIVVSGNIATATRSSGHGYEAKQVVEISGASPSSLNGEWRIATVDGNAFTFVTEGISDCTATGTIMCKVAAAGWISPFSDTTNIAGFQSPSAYSPGSLFVVDDTGTASANVRGIEDATSLSAGSNRFPNTTTSANLFSANVFTALADSRTFYLFFQAVSGSYYGCFGFGEFSSFMPGDTDNDICFGMEGTSMTTLSNIFQDTQQSTNKDAVIRRPYTGEANADTRIRGVRHVNADSGYGGPAFPSPIDNGLLLAPSMIRETTSGEPIRGRLRGIYWCSGWWGWKAGR